MPWPVMAYITTAMTTSCHDRPLPHSTKPVAARARRGTTMKIQRATCSQRALNSVVGICCSGRESSPSYSIVVTGASRTAFGLGGVMGVSKCGVDGYATVTYASVGGQPGSSFLSDPAGRLHAGSSRYDEEVRHGQTPHGRGQGPARRAGAGDARR